MTDASLPDLAAVRAAYARIRDYVVHTPVLACAALEERFGAKLFFKCENFQKTGAFKARGAFNAVLSLSETDAARGVATHSSGNHAAALALAARTRGIPAYIVIPRDTTRTKREAVECYGGRITFSASTVLAREETAAKIVAETGAFFIHPSNDDRVIAGQGTAALELLEEVPDLDVILVPVGGGGLLGGTAVVAKALRPSIQVIGVEPAGADDAARSFGAGQLLGNAVVNTIADGLRSNLGDRGWAIIRERVDAILTVSEEAIVRARELVREALGIEIEPSSSVPVAAWVEGKLDRLRGNKVGIILSGGNVDAAEPKDASRADASGKEN